MDEFWFLGFLDPLDMKCLGMYFKVDFQRLFAS